MRNMKILYNSNLNNKNSKRLIMEEIDLNN